MSTANRIIKNTGFLYAKMGITMFISLYTTRLVLNALGASDFGVFSVVGGAIAMLGFLHAAMSGATQRFMSFYEGKGEKEKQKEIFNVSSVLHFCIALVLGLILLCAGYFFFNGVLDIEADRIYAAKIVYASLIVSTVFTVMTVPYEAVLNAHENMLYFSIVGILESLLKLAVALIIVYYGGDKLELYGMLMACIPLLILTIMRLYCHKKYSECIVSPRKYWNKSLMKEMTSFAGWNLLGSMSSMISQYSSGLIFNSFFGTVVNASQGIANQVSGQAGILGGLVSRSISPVIVKKIGAKEFADSHKILMMGVKMMLLLESIVFLPIMLNADEVLSFWLGNYPIYIPVFIKLIFIINLINTFSVLISVAIKGVGQIKKFEIIKSLLNLLPLLLSIVLFYLGAPAYFLYLAVMSSAIIIITYSIYYYSRIFQKSVKKIYVELVLSFTMCFVISFYSTEQSFKFIHLEGLIKVISSTIFTLILFLGLYYTLGFNKNEKAHLLLKCQELLLKFK